MTKSIAGICTTALAAVGLLTIAAAPGYAQAQQQSPQQSPSVPGRPAAPTATNIPDSKLDATAKAVKKISSVKDSYDQKMAQAPTTERNKLADEADAAAKKAITEQGLSVEEYTTILEVAQSDATVRDKLIQRLR